MDVMVILVVILPKLWYHISDGDGDSASILCFASEAELREYQKKDRDEMITLFHDAKRAREYI